MDKPKTKTAMDSGAGAAGAFEVSQGFLVTGSEWDIEERSVTPGSEAHTCAISLYVEAFPPEERFNVEVLDALAERPGVDFTAYCRQDRFCGFSYCIDTGPYLYLLFLAVDSAARSQGHGTCIIARLKERYPGRVIVLEIEPIDPSASNARQRSRRLEFYRRCGFSPAGFDSIEGEMTYTVLATAGPFDPDDFVGEVTRITEGAIPMELRPARRRPDKP